MVMHKEKEENGMIHIHHSHSHPSDTAYRTRELGIFENGLLDADVFLQVKKKFLIFLFLGEEWSKETIKQFLIFMFIME